MSECGLIPILLANCERKPMSTLDKRKKDKIKLKQTNIGCLLATAIPLVLITVGIIVWTVIQMMQTGA